MTEKNYRQIAFYGKNIFIDESFGFHVDEEAKTLLVIEKNYTDFNAVLIYQEEDQSIKILPRWQSHFLLKGDAIYISREGHGNG
ncbi:hypothetical protein [Streptococcus ovuberis]|uniref:Uncharacterized protein n=1 Tax=Streptococcus ovuberis TaxID=1936207 RepID=A0A7X6N0X3_9STRE|nr:hypothetical protein [Streptococcus ovuberis]NKZ20182.1 hypothetical protein [Streptococcus ovuberis]